MRLHLLEPKICDPILTISLAFSPCGWFGKFRRGYPTGGGSPLWQGVVQDIVSSAISVPIDMPQSSYPQFVAAALQPLFELFDGFVLSDAVFGI